MKIQALLFPTTQYSSCPNRPAPCDWDSFDSHQPNPQVLYGAVVGGPDKHDVYKDDRKDYIKNEVACDYNSGFQASVAGNVLEKLSLFYLSFILKFDWSCMSQVLLSKSRKTPL